MKNKKVIRLFTGMLAAVLCMTAFSVTAFAGGGDGDDYTGEPAETTPEPTEEPAKPEGQPLTPEGNATLVDDYYGDKQLITVATKAGNYFYILIDRANEDKETAVHFLNQVDEADLMALLEDDSQNTPVVCSCTEKCTAGKVNTNCALCKTDMTNCAGKEATPEETEQSDEPTPEKKNNVGGILILVLILAAGGGGALWYFKLRKPKSSVKGGDELDEFDFDEDDEAEEYGDYEDADSASDPDKQENEE